MNSLICSHPIKHLPHRIVSVSKDSKQSYVELLVSISISQCLHFYDTVEVQFCLVFLENKSVRMIHYSVYETIFMLFSKLLLWADKVHRWHFVCSSMVRKVSMQFS